MIHQSRRTVTTPPLSYLLLASFSEQVRDDALDVERQIDEAVRQARGIVSSIIEHAQNLKVGRWYRETGSG